jgi:hypothetical protein
MECALTGNPNCRRLSSMTALECWVPQARRTELPTRAAVTHPPAGGNTSLSRPERTYGATMCGSLAQEGVRDDRCLVWWHGKARGFGHHIG